MIKNWKRRLATFTVILTMFVGCGSVENEVTKGEVTFSFNDMGEPGVSYDFVINMDKQEVSMNIVYFASTGEGPTEMNNTVKVNDESVWNDVKSILSTDILEESDENIYGYKYYDAVNMLCYTLEDIAYAQTDGVLYEKGVDGGEYWDSLYGDYDTNKDGKVTYRENFNNHIKVIMQLLKEGK